MHTRKPGASSLIHDTFEAGNAAMPGPGKHTLTEQLGRHSAHVVQRRTSPADPPGDADRERSSDAGDADRDGDQDERTLAAAVRGTSGSGGALPHLDTIQRAFGGDHDLSGVRAHVGGPAAEAAEAMGADAFAFGSHVGFRGPPDLHTAAHEATHVVQQAHGVSLLGGVGRAGDRHEAHADAVADRVVSGRSAADLLPSGPNSRSAQWGHGAPNAAPQRSAWASGNVQRVASNATKRAIRAFKAQNYSVLNYVPSTGTGAFDLEYRPKDPLPNVKVSVRLQLNLINYLGQNWTDQNEKDQWFKDYKTAIVNRWSSQFSLRVKKNGWYGVAARPYLSITEDNVAPHYTLRVKKAANNTWLGQAGVDIQNYAHKSPAAYAAGAANAGKAGRNIDVGSTDIVAQPNWWQADVAGAEAKRMNANNPKTIDFVQNKWAIADPDRAKLADFARALSMTHQPKLDVDIAGHASTAENHAATLAGRRATNVRDSLINGPRVTHNLNVQNNGATGAGAGEQKVTLNVRALPANHPNSYDVAGHEFGHVLGLEEEYPGGMAVQKSAHYELVEEALGKKIADTFCQREKSSAAIMSSGLDVRPYHYVTLWEALGRATTPGGVTRTDWEILS